MSSGGSGADDARGGGALGVAPATDVHLVAVTGWLRSGTTLLAEMLGSTPRTVALGELHHIWRAWRLNTPCSCQAPARSCEVWGSAMGAALPEMSEALAGHLEELSVQLARNRNFFSLLPSRGPDDRVAEYLSHLKPLLVEVARAAGARSLIDTSKSGSSLLLMAMLRPRRFDVMHLVRDVRGVAWSQRQDLGCAWASAGDPIPPPQRSFVHTAAEWTIGNLALSFAGHQVGRYLRISYEDMLRTPRSHVEMMCRELGLDASRLEWEADPPALVLGPHHVIAGNVARFGSRKCVLALDEKWREGMPSLARVGLASVAAFGRVAFRSSDLVRTSSRASSG